jgi:hypothetical protein
MTGQAFVPSAIPANTDSRYERTIGRECTGILCNCILFIYIYIMPDKYLIPFVTRALYLANGRGHRSCPTPIDLPTLIIRVYVQEYFVIYDMEARAKVPCRKANALYFTSVSTFSCINEKLFLSVSRSPPPPPPR